MWTGKVKPKVGVTSAQAAQASGAVPACGSSTLGADVAHATPARPAAACGAGGDGEDAFVLSGDSGDSFGVGFSAGHGRVPCGGREKRVMPFPLLKGYNADGGSQVKRSDFPKIKPHRPTAAGRLSDVVRGRLERRAESCVIFVSLGVPIKGVIIRRWRGGA